MLYLTALLLIIISLLTSSPLEAYTYENIFEDSFIDGDAEEWSPILGTWFVDNNEYCQDTCFT